ncbi:MULTISPECIES: hypothetical protein [unclassified Burkholderia]|uniref:hypothetical protein n=1 Tax=unclassified Burkholderia TaxID=2613784 RepID=UPI000F58784C|nr:MULTISPECIES: hypothetical protein [unclassified Burkholderia]RQR70525.1 hypothetical protein DIE10_36215 [Burkholderia sp. Bp9011]RQR83601.1 hypothetical protein DIE09_36230 [Burkholderia sp. Bp9010]RQS64146.1 hypothetical protein DID97_34685 [Burkholderia sp. Bp8977]
MNLHGIAAPCVAAVNPWVTVSLQASSGYTTTPDGTRTPISADPVTMAAQVQSLTYKDLVQLDGLNIQGEQLALYLYGNWQGVLRPEIRGGDLVTLPDDSLWLVTHVLENWSLTSNWRKVAITRQQG